MTNGESICLNPRGLRVPGKSVLRIPLQVDRSAVRRIFLSSKHFKATDSIELLVLIQNLGSHDERNVSVQVSMSRTNMKMGKIVSIIYKGQSHIETYMFPLTFSELPKKTTTTAIKPICPKCVDA